MNIELNHDINDEVGANYKFRCQANGLVYWEVGEGWKVDFIGLSRIVITSPDLGEERYESDASIHDKFPESQITKLKEMAKARMLELVEYDHKTLSQVIPELT